MKNENDTDVQLEEGLEHLKHIQEEITELKEETSGRWNAFRRGLWQGAGTILGGVAAIVLLGWILFLLGFIPGLGSISKTIQDAASRIER